MTMQTSTGARTRTSSRTSTVIDSRLGPITLVATSGVLSAVLLPELDGTPARGEHGLPDPTGLEAAAEQLGEYLAGQRTAFDLALHLDGTPFQRLVWEGLLRIPYGQTRSYGELALEIGVDPRTSSRAVGAANGRNPLAIVVPCHRVIGADGSLTGYAGGIERKRYLLDLESALLF